MQGFPKRHLLKPESPEMMNSSPKKLDCWADLKWLENSEETQKRKSLGLFLLTSWEALA